MFARYKLQTGVNQTNRAGEDQKLSAIFPVYYGRGTRSKEILFSINNSHLNLQTDWMPFGFSPNANIANSEVVFAGFGIVSAEAKYDDYAGLDIRNKIVAVFAGTPESGNPRSPFARFNTPAKAKIARRQRRERFLIISSEKNFQTKNKSAQLNYDQTLGESSIPAIIISRSGRETYRRKRMKKKWRRSKNGSPNPQRRAGKYCINLPQSIRRTKDQSHPKTNAEAYNVIGILEGRDAVLKNEAIVIGAHYDHLGAAARAVSTSIQRKFITARTTTLRAWRRCSNSRGNFARKRTINAR